MDRRWNGRFLREATLVGPEARGGRSDPNCRDEWRMSPGIVGLYPVGEGAGYAGGIISAAVDGLRGAGRREWPATLLPDVRLFAKRHRQLNRLTHPSKIIVTRNLDGTQ
jgi:hypothetical protein